LSKISRIRKSRHTWKSKAVSRATHLRRQRKKSTRFLKRQDARRLELEERISFLECENASLRSSPAQKLPAIVGESPFDVRRTSCVLMVIEGIVSFRAVPRIWGVLQRLGWVHIQIPHFTSVIHWTLRAGITLFNAVGPTEEPWLAILDCSIDIGTRKALVVLRVPLSALHQKQDAIGLQDCQCIGLKIATRWNGPLVKDALVDIFGKAGIPQGIIKDGGTDIKRGVELYQEAKDAKTVPVIEDVGHVAANALKAAFAQRPAFSKFLEIVRKGAARIRQTDLAWLLPPKIRTKGRFQGITALAQWAGKVLDLMGGPGRSKENSEVGMLRKAFHGLSQLRLFLEQFCTTCLVTEQFLKLLKLKGLNQTICSEAKLILKQLPQGSHVRARLSSWIDRHIQIQRKLAIGQLPLLVSSDVIESLFGKFKTIVQRNPQAELNRLVYIIPLLCGHHTSAEIARALQDCSHGQMLGQIQKTIPATLRQQRYRILDSASSGRVPETGTRKRFEAG
jgi:hypothetical protein